MKICRVCSCELDNNNKQPSCGRICRVCFRNYVNQHNRKKYKKDPGYYCEIQRDYTKRLKLEVISNYSPKHRKSIKRSSGQGLYQWLKKNEFPDGFQVLCMNCQFIKREENHELRTRDQAR